MSEDTKAAVRDLYGRVVQRSGGCCCSGGADVVEASERMGYDRDDADMFAEVANLGLGCGAPLAIAELQAGETVLDLGSGAGFDAFLARREVGETGRVIGVDMTPEMLAKARDNAAKLGYDNVDFRAGDIEALPLDDASVDVVISNCVLNLVPDKDAAFAEIARVLKPGGRMIVSDIVRVGELPESIARDVAAWSACGAGAIAVDDYLARLKAAGLERVEVVGQREARDILVSNACCDAAAAEPGGSDPLAALPEGVLASATIRAFKPKGCCECCS